MMKIASYFRSKWTVALLLFVGSSVLWIGCGKKGPPRPPKRALPAAVIDLDYKVRGDIVELNWTVPGNEQSRSAALPAAVRVFRSRLSAEEADCENCPIRFAVSGEIPIHRKRSEKSQPLGMSYSEFIEPGYRYIYMVTVFDEYGIGGKDSNTVQFDH